MKPLASLTAIGALCALLLAGPHRFTADDIEANRDAHAWRVAFELVGSEFPTADLRWDGDRLELPDGVRLQRSSVNGYAGEIEFLAAFRPEPGGMDALAGVRVTRHRETPGLGDFIDTARSPWIHQFSDKLPDDVDAVTGATITSEAVKRGVSALLRPVAEPPLPDETETAPHAVPAREATESALTRPGASPAQPGDNP
ncbi:MAG: FMN-binding protein [Gammaproteobacteria bacterium]|nr:FMN-binding protein [Gammaproteobacteria bacterium]